jgi:lysine-specific demethylase 8
MRDMIPIERVDPPSPEEFAARYVRASRPVILRGAIDHWPAMKLWSREYFKRRFGDRRVPVIRQRHGAMYAPATGLFYEDMRVADYVDRLESCAPLDLYMVVRIHEMLPEIFGDIAWPAYCHDATWHRARFWFAAPDTKGPLHRDLPENLYAQISGRKQFVMLDRRFTRLVHRHPFYSGVPNYSPVDAVEPDLLRHPNFRDAPCMLATLEPGDLFYIPQLWWHQAHSIDTSLSVNLWWASGALAATARAAELFMRVRDLKL